ncbi:hypothetical protein BV20DRAFT_169115 [Pilatotrama ljubarskyi]|nr:hypothetical protein BV20DRAFT_169115 [Pilatotrama ljubarskyi]
MSTSVQWRVMATIIQSEAVYSVAIVFNLVAYIARSELVLITLAVLAPLVGFSFTTIITRIGLDEVLVEASDMLPPDTAPVCFKIGVRRRRPSPSASLFLVMRRPARRMVRASEMGNAGRPLVMSWTGLNLVLCVRWRS